jgi:hypothetical protein
LRETAWLVVLWQGSNEDRRKLAAVQVAERQLEGLWDGYLLGAEHDHRVAALSKEELYLLNALGDTAMGIAKLASQASGEHSGKAELKSLCRALSSCGASDHSVPA